LGNLGTWQSQAEGIFATNRKSPQTDQRKPWLFHFEAASILVINKLRVTLEQIQVHTGYRAPKNIGLVVNSLMSCVIDRL
jgi:hypothetical protein